MCYLKNGFKVLKFFFILYFIQVKVPIYKLLDRWIHGFHGYVRIVVNREVRLLHRCLYLLNIDNLYDILNLVKYDTLKITGNSLSPPPPTLFDVFKVKIFFELFFLNYKYYNKDLLTVKRFICE